MTVKAHQVLSDLEKYAPNYVQDKPKGVDDNYVPEAISKIKALIRNSIKFKFGEFGDLEGLFSKNAREKLYGPIGLFVTKEDEPLHFPFDQCYFEFAADHRTEGKLHYALLTDYDKGSDSFVLTMFQKCQSTNNIWVLNKFSLIVEMGPPKPGAKSNLSVICIWDDSKTDFDSDGVASKYFTIPLMFLTLGLTVLTCNNVYYKSEYPDRALQKKRARKGKKPLYEYKALYVMPPGARYKSGPPKHLWTTRVNFRIGGWKNYPPPGLFGKYPGRFWFNGIARGDASQGVVGKEYDVTRMV